MNPVRRSVFEMDSHLSALDSGEWLELERIVERFEGAWRSGATPALVDFLPPHDPSRSIVLCELAATDLEWRWRSGQVATVERYLSEFPGFEANPRLVVELAISEFIARRRAGVAVDVPEFIARFPGIATTLRARLAEVMLADSLGSSSWPGTDLARNSRVPIPAAVQPASPTSPPSTSNNGTRPVLTRVGRYRLVRRIGSGSFGTVHEAIDTELGRRVALKLPRNALELRHDERSRFVREARNLARLSHPAIVSVLDAGSCDGTFYIAFSLVDGPTLADRLVDGALDQRTAAKILATIADALDYAHRQGIVHRDVKPSNILLDANGLPWLTDFGLASHSDSDVTLTVEGHLLGTPAYMAPEQASGQAHRVDGRSDVYSLGAVLYECLTGQLPFLGSPSAVLDQIRTCEPLPPTRLCRQLDHDLQVICLKAMGKRPADRYASAAQMADDLRRYLADEPIRARQPGPLRRLAKWARRRPAAAALAAVTLSAILSVTLLVWWHNVQLRSALIQTDEARQQAEELRLASENNQRQTENLLYAADMRLATTAYLNGDRHETISRLRKYLTDSSRLDRREFAWRRLWSLCNADQRTLTGHVGDVYVVQVVDQGRRLVTAGRDGTLRLWDVSSGKTAQIFGPYGDELNFAALAADTATLATGGDDGTIRLFDIAAGRQIGQFVGHANWALCGAMSPRGDQLATSGRDNVIRLWSIPAGELVAELPGHTTTVESLAYLPDCKSLVSTGSDSTLRIWDLETRQGAVIATHPACGNGVACSHDGRQLATACSDYNVYVWDVESRGLRAKLRGHSESVQSVAFSPDDTRLASAGIDSTVRVWDLAQQRQIDSFLGHSSRVWSLAWFPDGDALASSSADGTVRIWPVGASRVERQDPFATEVTQVGFVPGDGRVWAQSKRGSVWIVEGDGTPTTFDAPTKTAAWARDANVLVVVKGDSQVRLYDAVPQPSFSTAELPIDIASAAISAAGDLLAVSGSQGELCLFELPTFRLRWCRSLSDSRRAPLMEFAAHDRELIVAWGDRIVTECQVSDGSMHDVFQPRLLDRVTVSPDAELIAASCRDRAIRIWDRRLCQEVACLQGHDGEVNALTFAPDGQTLASGTSAGSVTLWHTASWQELGTFKSSLAVIRGLAFSADGKTLAIGGGTHSGRGQVNLWETKPADDDRNRGTIPR